MSSMEDPFFVVKGWLPISADPARERSDDDVMSAKYCFSIWQNEMVLKGVSVFLLMPQYTKSFKRGIPPPTTTTQSKSSQPKEMVGKREVQKAVNTAQGLFQRWMELLQDPNAATKEEIDWTTNELRNSLRSIEWDLEDLDETISIVEANPRKFNLDPIELSKRKAFITGTRQTVKFSAFLRGGTFGRTKTKDETCCFHEMKDQMSSPSAQALAERKSRQVLLGDSGSQGWGPSTNKYSRLDRELQSANSHFIEDQQTQQQLIAEQQDEQLELVSGSIGVLKNMSQRIGNELDEQAVMLDDFSQELDSTQSRLDNVMKKLAKVSHMTSDRRQWCAIVVLLAILIVVLILFFTL
ncbi:syntaxin-6 isoform X1 [Latimeria chalumnae]|uniref:syntaxin-6 isoform X1 n=2 Tax=Latimeria chalumnae TaxID=7897 RepID=UPI0003C13324|nr:PREDICTED: syntaxin-6 isoform X2 [Latimeria chalumnae]|eukprot:XP_005991136.1 PREDICTED: syntaxin-6 isoform X2 [Latimeria chalumnae]